MSNDNNNKEKEEQQIPRNRMIERETTNSFVDYAKVPAATQEKPSKNRGGVGTHFPTLLHLVLTRAEKDGYDHICAWQSHGRGFAVFNRDKFVAVVMPNYFRQSQYASFQRQLNLYGFRRLSQKSSESGAYYHEKFLRTRADLCQEILRAKEKDMRAIKASQEEPDFGKMPPMPPITEEDIGTTENILMEQKAGTKEGQEMSAMFVESFSLRKKDQEDPLAGWLKKIAMSGVESTSNGSWMEPRPIAPVPMNNTYPLPSMQVDSPLQQPFALPKPGPLALPSFLTSSSGPGLGNAIGDFPLAMPVHQPTVCTSQHEILRKVSDVSFTLCEKSSVERIVF